VSIAAACERLGADDPLHTHLVPHDPEVTGLSPASATGHPGPLSQGAVVGLESTLRSEPRRARRDMRRAAGRLLTDMTIGTTLIRPTSVPAYSNSPMPVNHQSVTSGTAAAQPVQGRERDPDRTASTADAMSGGSSSPTTPVSPRWPPSRTSPHPRPQSFPGQATSARTWSRWPTWLCQGGAALLTVVYETATSTLKRVTRLVVVTGHSSSGNVARHLGDRLNICGSADVSRGGMLGEREGCGSAAGSARRRAGVAGRG
jgi:hypothetical protein